MDKNNWTYKKLGEVATFSRGLTYSKKDVAEDTSKKVLRSNNIDLATNSLNYEDIAYLKEDFVIPEDKILHKNDIFICMSNGSTKHLGKVAFIETETDYAFGGFMGAIHPKTSEVFPKFAFYFCLSNEYRRCLATVLNGININNIKWSDLSKFSIPIPPLAEQERIVAELDLLSSIIDKKKAQLKEYDQLAQSIFYDMFGDPITNEKGWEVKKLGEVCEYSKTRIKSEELTADNYVGVENLLQDCKGKIEANKVPDGMGLTEYIKGDVLLGNIRPYLKKIWLANNQGGCNGDVLAIRIQSDYSNHFLPIYIFGCLSKDSFFDYDMQYSKGEKMPRGDKKEIVKYPICVPPLPLQQEFASKVEAIERQKTLIQQSIDEVQTMFDYTMDKYFG